MYAIIFSDTLTYKIHYQNSDFIKKKPDMVFFTKNKGFH
ncbi:hypothetical protein RG47T_4409 [Mucilaginibacter polytrichastri]|uniref:Uncharacterized protein n=1 Tax=Mucilaginibacter polytrichastri TaxID=1302689 RepID=A0A1Q6A4I8_9SPHI|nr:hypothetical protein RG47T_4409 [Mucilaginibacter polytrichastri]